MAALAQVLVQVLTLSITLSVFLIPASFAQEKVDAGTVNRIWEEGVNRSKIMETLSYLTDVIGPRIPGSPAMKRAQEWAKPKFTAWGMANAAIEPCGEFGLGWSNEYISVHMTEPAYASLLAYAKPWTLGTQGKIKGSPLLAVIRTKADLEKWTGKLKGAIVLCDPPRQVHPSFKPYARRYTDDDLKKLMETPIPLQPKEETSGAKPGLKWEELYDNGSGRIRGIYIQENFQVRPIFEEWMKPLRDLGVTTIALQPTEGTDHLPFDYIGIPGFQFIQDPLDYFPTLHHTNQDIYDHCVAEDLVQSAVVMASFVYFAAMRDEMLPRKPLPIPVEATK